MASRSLPTYLYAPTQSMSHFCCLDAPRVIWKSVKFPCLFSMQSLKNFRQLRIRIYICIFFFFLFCFWFHGWQYTGTSYFEGNWILMRAELWLQLSGEGIKLKKWDPFERRALGAGNPTHLGFHPFFLLWQAHTWSQLTLGVFLCPKTAAVLPSVRCEYFGSPWQDFAALRKGRDEHTWVTQGVLGTDPGQQGLG